MTTNTMLTSPTEQADPVDVTALHAGGRIEVWNQFLGSWTGEFEIASVADEGYRIRRATDNEVLPRPFAAEDLRPVP
jgi:hypothetical protein